MTLTKKRIVEATGTARRRKLRPGKPSRLGKKGVSISALPSILIANIPEGKSGRGFRRQLLQAFKAYNCRRVKLEHNAHHHTRGFGHAYVETEADAQRLIADLNGKISLDGSVIRFTRGLPPSDKRDFLFPNYPTDVRAELKLDSVAIFSVMDQMSADRLSRLVRVIAAVGSPGAPPDAPVDYECDCEYEPHGGPV